jgi:DNA polymerase-3 subunit alpha
MLWSDDYVRYSQFLEKGKNLFITGSFRQRYNKEFEFKIERMTLLENIKQTMTKQLVLEMEARQVDEQLLTFLQENVKKHPGPTALKVNITEPRSQSRISLFSRDKGLEMNDELTAWIYENGDISVQVLSV